MMLITKKSISDDVTFIVNSLQKQDVTIPSFLACATPGIAVMLSMICMPLWDLLSGHSILAFNPMAKLDQLISIIMFFGLGFFIFILVTSARGKYLSLPMDVRKHSLIVQLVKRKVIFYSGLWLVINASAIAVNIRIEISDMFVWGIHFVSMIIIWFIAIVDLGRYDLALLSSAIKQWREGGDVDASLHKP